MDEFVQGIELYFNKIISTSLLYRSERKQHDAICQDKEPSSMYGVEHLLRLFVEIPSLVGETNMDTETLSEIREKFEELLRYYLPLKCLHLHILTFYICLDSFKIMKMNILQMIIS